MILYVYIIIYGVCVCAYRYILTLIYINIYIYIDNYTCQTVKPSTKKGWLIRAGTDKPNLEAVASQWRRTLRQLKLVGEMIFEWVFWMFQKLAWLDMIWGRDSRQPFPSHSLPILSAPDSELLGSPLQSRTGRRASVRHPPWARSTGCRSRLRDSPGLRMGWWWWGTIRAPFFRSQPVVYLFAYPAVNKCINEKMPMFSPPKNWCLSNFPWPACQAKRPRRLRHNNPEPKTRA